MENFGFIRLITIIKVTGAFMLLEAATRAERCGSDDRDDESFRRGEEKGAAIRPRLPGMALLGIWLVVEVLGVVVVLVVLIVVVIVVVMVMVTVVVVAGFWLVDLRVDAAVFLLLNLRVCVCVCVCMGVCV